jgi:hypothetical protein
MPGSARGILGKVLCPHGVCPIPIRDRPECPVHTRRRSPGLLVKYTLTMNPASRLISLVSDFGHVQTDQSATDGWKKILSLSGPEGDEQAYEAMQATLAEVRGVENRLAELGVPSELFTKTANALRMTFSPASSARAWKDLQGAVNNSETLLVLKWAAWVLSKFDEPDIDDEVLRTLQADVVEQKKML